MPTDHRDGVATDSGPGAGWPEDENTVHRLEKAGIVTAEEVFVDIVEQAHAVSCVGSVSCGGSVAE